MWVEVSLASSFLQNSFAQPFSFYTQGWAEPCAHSPRAGLANSGVCCFLLLNSGSYTTTWPPPLTEYLSKPPCGQPLCRDSQLICKGCGQSHPALFPEFHGWNVMLPCSSEPSSFIGLFWSVTAGVTRVGDMYMREGWSLVMVSEIIYCRAEREMGDLQLFWGHWLNYLGAVLLFLLCWQECVKEQHLQRSEIPFYLWRGDPSKGLAAPLCICHSCFLMFKMGSAEGCEI